MKLNSAHTKKKMFIYRGTSLKPILTFIRDGKRYKGYGNSFSSRDDVMQWAATAGKAFMKEDTLQK